MTIEFIHNDFSKCDVKKRLKESLEQTKILRGAVAFWAIGDDYFGDTLVNALKHKDSFYCVDVSMPTNFNALLGIQNKIGSTPKFYVHSKRIETNEGLLHSKVIFMDKGEEGTEIWIGSHNFTKWALGGTNIEGSVIISVSINEYDNSFYKNIRKHLEDIKNSCNDKPFDKSSYNYFTALQGSDYRNWLVRYFPQIFLISSFTEYSRTIEIIGSDLSNLWNSTIIILGSDKRELSEIERYGKNIIVHAINDDDGSVTFYRANLRARDKTDNISSKQVKFGKRRFGNIEAIRKRVILQPERTIDEQDLIAGGFYVNIEIKEQIFMNKNILIYSSPDFKELWSDKIIDKSVNIFEAKSFNEFEERFLPKEIYQIFEWESSFYQTTRITGTNKILDDVDLDERKFVSIFKRRIYIVSIIYRNE